jgi:hypothetical protein
VLPTIVAVREAVSPSEIDNSAIVTADKLRENLEEGTHFVIVSARGVGVCCASAVQV